MKHIILKKVTVLIRGRMREVWGLFTTSCGDVVHIVNTPWYDSMRLAFRGAKRFCIANDNYIV